MDGHPRGRKADGTELGLQTASLTHTSAPMASRAIRPQRLGGRAQRQVEGRRDQSSSGRKMWGAVQALQIGVADSRSPERGSGPAVRVEALDVVDPLAPDLHVDQPPECAALDPVRRQVVGVGLGRDDGSGRAMRVVGLVRVRRTDDQIDFGGGA